MALETGTVELQGKMLPLSDPSVKQLLSLCMAIVKNGLELGEAEAGEGQASMPAEMLSLTDWMELEPAPGMVLRSANAAREDRS